MIYAIRHLTAYEYAAPVDLAHHRVSLVARDTPSQVVRAQAVTIAPEPARRRDLRDHFGNPLTLVTIESPHTRLAIESRLRVEVTARSAPAATPAWERVRDAAAAAASPAALDAGEFRFDSPLVGATADLRAYALPSFPPGRPVLEGASDLMRRIHRGFTYDPTATDVSTPLARVLQGRRGVCQDFAHVGIGALRALGLPARYVSGYIRTLRLNEPGAGAWRGADASHAWFAVWCGEGVGWVDLDPTNDVAVGEQHATVAWGRDFADVSPVRGLLLGGGAHGLTVRVEMVAEG